MLTGHQAAGMPDSPEWRNVRIGVGVYPGTPDESFRGTTPQGVRARGPHTASGAGKREMNGFADQLMIRYLDPEKVDQLLMPLDDTGGTRIRALLATVHEPSLVEVRSVDRPMVTARRFQVPVTVPLTARSTLEKILPSAEQSRASLKISIFTPVHWIDMALDTLVPAKVAMTAGALAAAGSEDAAELTEAQFVAKFGRAVLEELLRRTGAADYEQLRADRARLHRLRSSEPPPSPRAPRAPRPGTTRCGCRCSSSPASASGRRCADWSRAGTRST